MNLIEVLKAVRARRATLILGTLLGIAAAAAMSYSTVHTYVSSTQLFVSAVARADDPGSAYQGELLSQQRVESYARLLTGPQLAQHVVDDLHLPLTARDLAGKITATAIPKTVLINVTVTDTSAERAHDIATSLATQFARLLPSLETGSTPRTAPVSVHVSQPADFNPAPVSPNPPSDLLRGAVVGFLAGLMVALLRTKLDHRVRTAADVRRATGLQLGGSVLDDSRLAKQPTSHTLDRRSRGAEAYRRIRMGLRHVGDDPPHVIVVTSPMPGEGKSTVAVNLAVSLAESGSRVALIDANLRRPRVARYLGLEEENGLVDVLAGRVAMRDVAQPWGDGYLTVLGAGPMPAEPGEILGSTEMRSLVQSLRESEEYVIIDAPPLLPVSDAAALSKFTDGYLVVVRFGKTERDDLEEAVATASRVGGTVLGVVLNRTPKSAVGGRSRSRAFNYGHDRDRGWAPRRARSSARRKSVPAESRTTLGEVKTDVRAAARSAQGNRA